MTRLQIRSVPPAPHDANERGISGGELDRPRRALVRIMRGESLSREGLTGAGDSLSREGLTGVAPQAEVRTTRCATRALAGIRTLDIHGDFSALWHGRSQWTAPPKTALVILGRRRGPLSQRRPVPGGGSLAVCTQASGSRLMRRQANIMRCLNQLAARKPRCKAAPCSSSLDDDDEDDDADTAGAQRHAAVR